jgi:3-deoxy-D-manno-octulosonic-acid transferase
MSSVVYNCALFVLFCAWLPKWLWQWFVLGKVRKNVGARCFCKVVKLQDPNLLWIHAVSVGEVRVASIVAAQIRKHFPHITFAISTTTDTGQEEAKRAFPDAKAHFILPLDFSWNMRILLHRLQPSWVLLMESDFWFHMLRIAEEKGIPNILVNGKISERSFKRFLRVPSFARALFSHFSVLCVQNETYKERFVQLGANGEHVHVTGNSKLCAESKRLSLVEKALLLEEWNLSVNDNILVIGSTHAREEAILLDALQPLLQEISSLRILLVPRHPERFSAVQALVKSKQMPAVRVVNRMGILRACYQIADLAIVGGSFIEHVGGHNIFEPVALDVPVFFGPFMHQQKDLARVIEQAGAGWQLSVQELPLRVSSLLQNSMHKMEAVRACQRLQKELQGNHEFLQKILFPFLARKEVESS